MRFPFWPGGEEERGLRPVAPTETWGLNWVPHLKMTPDRKTVGFTGSVEINVVLTLK